MSTSLPLRIGVLGAGRIGRLHAELVAGQVPGAELTAVADVDQSAATRLAADLGAQAAASSDEVIASSDVDAVIVSTSTSTHVDLVIAAARAGKAILCEKPISFDLSRVDEALAEVDRAGVPFMVGFNRRFDPGHASVRAAVAAGVVGDLHQLRITSRDPEPPPAGYVADSGGIFLDMTIHDFDMARFVTGSDVVEVYARGEVRIDPDIGAVGDVDTAVVVLAHEDGTLTTIENSRQAVYGFDQRVEAFGSGGLAVSDNAPKHAGATRTADGGRTAPLPWFFLDRYWASYRAEWLAFVEHVRSGRPSPVDGRAGRMPSAIALAARRSLVERRVVRVDEIG